MASVTPSLQLVTPSQVNIFTTSTQDNPSVTALSDGGYVVTWTSTNQATSSSGWDIYAQRYDAAGARIGNEFLVNKSITYNQLNSSVTTLSNGNFVVSWQNMVTKPAPDLIIAGHHIPQKIADFDITAQLYSATGVKIGGQFQVNTLTHHFQEDPQIFGLSNGGFAAVWSTAKGYGDTTADVYSASMQLFNSTGTKVGSQITLITANGVPVLPSGVEPTVTELANGNLLVMWKQIDANGNVNSIAGYSFAQLYDTKGGKVGSPITFAKGFDHIEALSDGGYVLSYHSLQQTYFSIYDANGSVVQADIPVGTAVAADSNSSFAVKADGSLVFVYVGTDAQLNSHLYVRHFDASTGLATTNDTLIDNTLYSIDHISVEALSGGGYVVTWSASLLTNPGDAYDVYSITYSPNDQQYTKFTGTAAINTLTGTSTDDFITGLAGNDTISAGDGYDYIDGGTGNDSMAGGAGNDTYVVDVAGDHIVENLAEGVDTAYIKIATAKGTYTLESNLENATLQNVVAFNLIGNTLDNILIGNAAANTLDGSVGADVMKGGAGNDVYVVDNLGDVVVESSSIATEIDTVKSSVDFTLGDNLEKLILMSAGLTGTGNALANTITGTSGADTLDGGAGKDVLIGGTGNDIYVVDTVGDVITETSKLASEVDLVKSSISWLLGANLEQLTLTGSQNINGTGNTLNNLLTGNSGNNVLNGGAGLDSYDGGLGDDTYIVDQVAELANITDIGGSDTVQIMYVAKVPTTLTAGSGDLLNIENITVVGAGSYSLVGDANANILIGNAQANTLTGNDGDDILIGGAGIDTLIGGAGNDTYVVDNINDIVTETGTDVADLIQSTIAIDLNAVKYDGIENVTLTGKTALNATGDEFGNILTGNSAANKLSGGAGIDTLIGGAGADVLTGGDGSDTFIFNSLLGTDQVMDFTSFGYSNADQIYFDTSVFTHLTGSMFDKFVSSSSGVALDYNDYLLYNTTTKTLSYDADGNGIGKAIAIAKFVGVPSGLSFLDVHIF